MDLFLGEDLPTVSIFFSYEILTIRYILTTLSGHCIGHYAAESASNHHPAIGHELHIALSEVMFTLYDQTLLISRLQKTLQTPKTENPWWHRRNQALALRFHD